MGASITLAGESLIAQKQGAQQPLIVSRFVLANVPGLNPNGPVDRAAPKPAAHLVASYDVTQKGFVNPSQVVYSLMMGSDIGDFDWNWIGLETAENVLLAVAYVPVQQKRKNIPPQQVGNNVTRNFLVVFDGAQALTGITVDASTWQHDFTVRLHGIDERERLSNRDIYGRACFFGSAFQVEKVGSDYRLKPGMAYVEGIRLVLPEFFPVAVPRLPSAVYLIVSLRRELSDVVASWTLGYEANQADYTDSSGTRHYCIALADLTPSQISDYRAAEPINSPLISHFAARTGDYPQLRARATTKGDVGLSNVPNAISDDYATDNSLIIATTKAVNSVRRLLQQAIDKIISGDTPAGKAKRLETPRTLSISGAGTGEAQFDGGDNATIPLTLADSGVKAGTYPKVQVNAKGIVVGAQALSAQDIPGLDWSKITSGKPNTLNGYGITDAIHAGDYGLAGTTSPSSAIDHKDLPGGFHYFGAGYTTFSEYVGLINIPYGFSSYSGQIGLQQGTDDVKLLVRSVNKTGDWTPTRSVWHNGNFDPNTKADAATTLEGYGITNAIPTGLTNKRPQLYAPQSGDGFDRGALEIREAEAIGSGSVAAQYAPRISFHWRSVASGGLSMNAAGELLWNGRPLWHSGNGPKNTASLGDIGFWRCADTGVVLQWGTVAAHPAVAQSVSFRVAFNVVCFGVLPTTNNASGGANADSGYQIVSKRVTGFTAYRQDYNITNIGQDSGYSWFAVGF